MTGFRELCGQLSDYKLLYNLHVQLEHPPPTVVRKCIAEGGTDVLLFQSNFSMLNMFKFNS